MLKYGNAVIDWLQLGYGCRDRIPPYGWAEGSTYEKDWWNVHQI
jgi:hypothetical protein